MKSLILIAAATLAASTAFGSACVGDSLADYMASGFSCTIGNLEFSNFTYSGTASPSGDAIGAASIEVTLFDSSGFTFTSGWDVTTQEDGNSSFQDSVIGYSVQTVNGQATIEDLGLGFNGSVTGNGVASVTEQYCLGTTAGVGACVDPPTLGVSDPPGTTSNDVVFGLVSELSVSKDIDVTSGVDYWSGGYQASTANISTVTNSFSQISVPEPVSMLMMGGGLVLLGVIRRRKPRG